MEIKPLEPKASASQVAWSHLVLVCKDCFSRVDGPLCPERSADVKAKLKTSFKELKPKVRTLETSCMAVCPAKSFLVVNVPPCSKPESFVLSSLEETQGVIERVRKDYTLNN